MFNVKWVADTFPIPVPLQQKEQMIADNAESPVRQVLEPHLLIGVPSIDREHGVLVSLLNRLIDRPEATPESEAFADLLSRLGGEIAAHFRSEEKIFTSSGMPSHLAEQHIQAHSEILEQYTELNLEFMKGRAYDRAEVLTLIRNWIIEHLMLHDVRIRDYL